MAILLSAAKARLWVNDIAAGADLSPSAATNATPTVVTATAHGLSSGDVIAEWGFATNTAANGVFWVTVVDANSYQLSSSYANYVAGTFVAGNGTTGAGHGSRLSCNQTPKDVENIARTLRSMSYVRDSDSTYLASTNPGYGSTGLESTIKTIFGQ